MAYQSIARKYRPQSFDDLKGQSTLAIALTNAIKLRREPHAVILSGIRGIGKTTTARLYAKALNCQQGPTDKPCNQCESCLAINSGWHEDVFEIDGASHTSVEDIRNLQETLNYVPQRSKFKVYIVDEVHMLSTSAFNALLKTLEEPPSHVIFIFATTELNKVPATIISRCATFHLQKFALDTIVNRMREILKQEAISFEPKAVSLIAKEGHGSMRDALTILDQVIALGDGSVNCSSVEQVISSISSTVILELLETLITKQAPQLIEHISHIDQSGVDMIRVAEELARFSRHAFIIKDLGVDALDTKLLSLDDHDLERLRQIAELADSFDLNRVFRMLIKCRQDLDGSELDRFIFENYGLEWCLDPGLPNLEDLRQMIKNGTADSVQPSNSNSEKKLPLTNYQQQSDDEISKPCPTLGAFPETWRELVERWKQKKPLQARIIEEACVVQYSPEKIVLSVDDSSLAASRLLSKDVQQKIVEQFKELFQFNGQLVAIKKDPLEPSVPNVKLPESLLDEKRRTKEVEQKQLIEDIKNDPLTKEILQTFGGKIDKIEITDPI